MNEHKNNYNINNKISFEQYINDIHEIKIVVCVATKYASGCINPVDPYPIEMKI